MMNQELWQQQYPQMPEEFHLAVKEAVTEALSGTEEQNAISEKESRIQKGRTDIAEAQNVISEKEKLEREKSGILVRTIMPKNEESEKRRFTRKKKYGILLLAAALTAVIAAVSTLSFAGRKPLTAEEMLRANLHLKESYDYSSLMKTDVPVKVEETPLYPDYLTQKTIDGYQKLETDEPLLEIKSVFYDGLTLAFVAAPTEEAQKYKSFESFDTRINGEAGAAGLMYVAGDFDLKKDYAHNGNSGEGYLFEGTVYDLDLESPFTVTVPLGVYGKEKRCENQDFTFTVDITPQTEDLPDQEFVQDDFTVSLTSLKKSPASLYGIITIKMTEAQYDTYTQNCSAGTTPHVFRPYFTDSEGNQCTTRPYKTDVNEDGAAIFFDFVLTEGTYVTSTPFLLDIPDPGAAELILAVTGYDQSSDTYDPADPANRLGNSMNISLKQ